jgi:hypothetical protein
LESNRGLPYASQKHSVCPVLFCSVRVVGQRQISRPLRWLTWLTCSSRLNAVTEMTGRSERSLGRCVPRVVEGEDGGGVTEHNVPYPPIDLFTLPAGTLLLPHCHWLTVPRIVVEGSTQRCAP